MRDYARKPELRDDLSHIEWIKKPPFRALQWESPTKESEFKKPYLEPDHVRMEHFPQWPFPWRPWFPEFPGPIPTESGPWYPGGPVFWKVCMPGCHFNNPRSMDRDTSEWIKIEGFCPSIFRVVTEIVGDGTGFTVGAARQFADEDDDSVWGALVTAAADADGEVDVKFTISRYGFMIIDGVVTEDSNDIIIHIVRCRIKAECCPGNLTFDDGSTADTIVRENSITVYITDGCPPFDWSVTGVDTSTGFSLSEAQTTARENTLNASDVATGTADISITDACGDTVHAYIMCTTGTWKTWEKFDSSPAGCWPNDTFMVCDTREDVSGGYYKWVSYTGNSNCCEGEKTWECDYSDGTPGIVNCVQTPPWEPAGCVDPGACNSTGTPTFFAIEYKIWV